jgi:hypothetical protein
MLLPPLNLATLSKEQIVQENCGTDMSEGIGLKINKGNWTNYGGATKVIYKSKQSIQKRHFYEKCALSSSSTH